MVLKSVGNKTETMAEKVEIPSEVLRFLSDRGTIVEEEDCTYFYLHPWYKINSRWGGINVSMMTVDGQDTFIANELSFHELPESAKTLSIKANPSHLHNRASKPEPFKKETLERIKTDTSGMSAHNILFEINLRLQDGFDLIRVQDLSGEGLLIFEKTVKSE